VAADTDTVPVRRGLVACADPLLTSQGVARRLPAAPSPGPAH
jgi:hypothetical protein